MDTILYVEDHPPARMLMEAIFHDLLPQTLITAANGEEALAKAREQRPALYIVDLDLPDTDGIALGRALREVHPAPIILVSAFAEAITPEVLADVAQAYIPKPLDPDYVAEVIRRTLA